MLGHRWSLLVTAGPGLCSQAPGRCGPGSIGQHSQSPRGSPQPPGQASLSTAPEFKLDTGRQAGRPHGGPKAGGGTGNGGGILEDEHEECGGALRSLGSRAVDTGAPPSA